MPEAVYGILRVRTDPEFVQGATGSGNSSFPCTLPYYPAPGSVLVAWASSIQGQASSPSCTGGGVNLWNMVDFQHVDSGSQLSAALFWGIVGSSPSKSVTPAALNSGCGGVVEIRGLYGYQYSMAATVTSSSSVSLPAIAVPKRGVVLAFEGSRTNINTFPSFMRLINRANVNTEGVLFFKVSRDIVPYTTSFTTFGGNTGAITVSLY